MRRLDSSTGSRWRNGGFKMACCGSALLLLLALAGCSGDGNNGGGGGGSGSEVTVIVSPSTALVQLNQTLQMSSAVVNAPTLALASTNGAVRATNVVTITTVSAHGFAVGNPVQISGVTDTSFIGTFLVATVPSATTFTFAQNGADATSGGGTVLHTAVRWQVNGVDGGAAATGTISVNGLYTAPPNLPPIITATIGAGGAVRASNTVTITTSAAHTFTAGQVVTIIGVTDPPPVTATIAATNGAVRTSNFVTITTTAAHGFFTGQLVTIAGVADTTFNGNFVISSVPSATTFAFLQVAADATSTGGTASVPGTSFNGTFAIATAPSATTFTYAQLGANATSGGGTANTSGVLITAISVADTSKTGTASVGLDSGIILTLTPTVVTVATGEFVQFTATNSGATATTINFLVNDVAGGNATVGTILATGRYTAPAAVPNPATVTVKAQAAADPTKFVTATVTIASAALTPTMTSLWPTVVAQGAAFQDFYIVGTNFISTTAVRFNGMLPPTAPIAVTSTLLRVRIPASMLDMAGVGMVPMQIDTQGGLAMPPAPINVMVTAERPALVGPSPDSVLQGVGVTPMDLHGGYYSTNSTVAEFDNGSLLGTTPDMADPSRKLQAAVNPNQTPGLYAVTVRNAGAAQPIAVTNLAIQPDLTVTAPTVGAPIAVGAMPSAVAMNTATGRAVVLNSGANPPTISVVDVATNAVVATHATHTAAGSSPTGLAVDSVRNLAVVANNGTNDISVINIATGALTIIPPQVITGTSTQLKPVSVGVNPVTGLGLVANQSTNEATVIDLTVVPPAARPNVSVSTGTNPRVAIEPRLNWAIVTPGGAGPVTIVDLAAPNATPARPAKVIATVLLGSNTRGISVNTETRRALLTDPGSAFAQIFSVLDQTVATVTASGGTAMEVGHVATATNPFTDLGVAVNPTTDMVSVIDMRRAQRVAQFAAGTDPVAVDIDPGMNKAVIANQADGTVSIATLGPIRGLQVLNVNPPLHIAPTPAADLVITVTGAGFTGAAVVRVDEMPLATVVVSARQLTATIPAALLNQARSFAVDVLDTAGRSNVVDLPIVKAVTVGAGMGTEAPIAVAIDQQRDLAVVANSGTDQASIVDLNTLAVTNVTVGDNPQGVAIYSRGARAVVSNRGSSTVSMIDIDPMSATFGTQVNTGTVGAEPIGVAVNDDLGQAVVANSVSNTVTIVNIADGTIDSAAALSPDIRPVAVAVDSARNLAAVANVASNSVAIVNMAPVNPVVLFRITNVNGANGVVYDPVSDRFIATAALGNTIAVIDTVTRQATQARVGINPTSIAYNGNSSTLVTVNSASDTVSVMDFLDRRIRAILPLSLSSQGAVAIHPRTNVAVFVDTANNRILLVQLPK